MSASPHMLTLSTENLSMDGTQVLPDEKKPAVEISEAAALATLKAFASLPSVDLVDVEAKLYLTGPRGKIAVQNVRGKLFVAFVPVSVNPSVERTPEETIVLLTAGDPTAASAAVAAEEVKVAELIAETSRQPKGARDWVNSAWVLAVLVVVTAVAAYLSFAPDTPEGIEIIHDPGKIASLHASFNGRYGADQASNLVLDYGKLKCYEPTAEEPAGQLVFELHYGFGLTPAQVAVAVVDNGAVLELQKDRSLKFLDSVYPRQGN